MTNLVAIANLHKAFVARLAGLPVLGPDGDDIEFLARELTVGQGVGRRRCWRT